MSNIVKHIRDIPRVLYEKLAGAYGDPRTEARFSPQFGSDTWQLMLLHGQWTGYAIVLHAWENLSTKSSNFYLVEGASEAVARKNAGEGHYLCRILVNLCEVWSDALEFQHSQGEGRYLFEHYYPLMREVQDEARAMLNQLGLVYKLELHKAV